MNRRLAIGNRTGEEPVDILGEPLADEGPWESRWHPGRSSQRLATARIPEELLCERYRTASIGSFGIPDASRSTGSSMIAPHDEDAEGGRVR